MVASNFHIINILLAYISNRFYFGEFERAAGKVYSNRIWSNTLFCCIYLLQTLAHSKHIYVFHYLTQPFFSKRICIYWNKIYRSFEASLRTPFHNNRKPLSLLREAYPSFYYSVCGAILYLLPSYAILKLLALPFCSYCLWPILAIHYP